MSAPRSRARIEALITQRLQEWCGPFPDGIDAHRPLAELGLSSRQATQLAAELATLTGQAYTPSLVFQYPTIAALRDAHADSTAPAGDAAPPAPTGPAVDDETIAVVGVGCRLPGAVRSPEDYWKLLMNRTDAISRVPSTRWSSFCAGTRADIAVHQHTNPWGGFLDDIASFDAGFFHITPHEAAVMDPQQRLLLEVTQEALDHAAIAAGTLAGSLTGVFVGISSSEYAHLTNTDVRTTDATTLTGASPAIAANRLSYALDLRGPSLAIDTACSSSLVAIHQACRSLQDHESDLALAGGVNLLLSPTITRGFQETGVLAPDGRIRAFDAAAAGTVRGEGCGVVVLKRLSDAQRDQDRVLAVIAASAVNSDGRSNGLLAPSPAAQHALLETAYRRAGVDPSCVDYIEAHGTGTSLGDPIEAHALGRVLGAGRADDQELLIGSAKTNLGHLEAAAGVIGLIKTVLALARGTIPPSLHFSAPNPHIDFNVARLRVATSAQAWPRHSGRATAGVSAFGFGGTNAHIVLRETPVGTADRRTSTRTGHLSAIVLSAREPEGLRGYAQVVRDWLHSPEGIHARPADIAHTLARRSERGPRRAALMVRTREELLGDLGDLVADRASARVVVGTATDVGPGPVWLFSGHGPHPGHLGTALLGIDPAFTAAIDRLEPLLRTHAGISLRDSLTTPSADTRPENLHPVLFGVQIALADMWRAHGVVPAAVIGHSFGEIAAAVVAGALSEADAARLLGVRSRLLGMLTGGAMALVERSPEQVGATQGQFPDVHVAVHASPRQCVISGPDDQVLALAERIREQGSMAKILPVTGAGHSPQVDHLAAELSVCLQLPSAAGPALRFYSTVLDDPRAVPAFDTAYWAANLRRPVLLSQAVRAAVEDGHRLFVEVSARPVLLHPVTQTLAAAGGASFRVQPTLRQTSDGAVDFRQQLGTLLTYGLRLTPAEGQVVDLPSPPWNHRPYWFQVPRQDAAPAVSGSPGTTDRGSSALERACRLVAQVTGLRAEDIDPHTPLTALGLTSLTAARLHALLSQEPGISVPAIEELLRGATLSDITADAEGQRPPHSTTAEPRSAGAPSVHVQGRDATERMVALAWADALRRSRISVRQDLAELGGDLPAAERAAALLSRTLQRPVDPYDLHRHRTIEQAAAHFRPLVERDDGGPLRTLNATGDRQPLFLAHPAGGSSVVYRPLAELLKASGHPCYGLDRVEELTTVEEKAKHYARLILGADPQGPVLLGGWSFGGCLALATAHRLRRAGRRVEAVFLIDSVLPLPTPQLTREQDAERRFAPFAAYVERTYQQRLALDYGDLAQLDDTAQIEHIIQRLQASGALPAPILEHQRASYLDLRVAERHVPSLWTGRTVLFRAQDQAARAVRDRRFERTDEGAGWQEFCTDLAVVPVTGHHLSLLDPPNVQLIAQHIAELTGTSAAV
ncbi:beta-ketoacyl synthase N-terminal-like domain-containing protein [Streptomyces fildesensis]|uniref:Beta-ketoacyl synthase N-terminal-like domain-containing protein n=1 Tax=Streptomyces fildesensis TaxID=375757 RepID=A0ABW8C4U1_9ACTN